MPRISGWNTAACLCLAILWTATGCNKSNTTAPTTTQNQSPATDADHADHDHANKGADAQEHDHADAAAEMHTFAEGVAALDKHYQEIKDALTQNDAEKAHDPMHAIGYLLEDIPELGKTAGLSTEDARNSTGPGQNDGSVRQHRRSHA